MTPLRQVLRHWVHSLPRPAQEFLSTTLRRSFNRIRCSLWRRPFPTVDGGKVYVHLGCGYVDHPKFINVDAIALPHIHYVRTVENLAPFNDDFADLVYVSHCLEHISHRNTVATLKEWHRVLKPGGVLRLSVPDFDVLLKIYQASGRDMDSIQLLLTGGQDYAFNYHKAMFTFDSLAKLLSKVGFAEIERWTPGSCELTSFEDYSKFEIDVNGTPFPISLNVQARKRSSNDRP